MYELKLHSFGNGIGILVDMDQTNLHRGRVFSLWQIRNYECSMNQKVAYL